MVKIIHLKRHVEHLAKVSPNGLRHVERAHHQLERRVLQVRAAKVGLAEVAARQVAELRA